MIRRLDITAPIASTTVNHWSVRTLRRSVLTNAMAIPAAAMPMVDALTANPIAAGVTS